LRMFWQQGQAASKAPKQSMIRDENTIRVIPTQAAPVRVQVVGENSLDVLKARDISVAGIGVQVDHDFNGIGLDEEIELVITLPNTKTFLAKGVIRHRNRNLQGKTHFGLEFVQITERCRELIRSYIRQNFQLH
jgi:c-di-GMP-binding flagellar brake protein YcgR